MLFTKELTEFPSALHRYIYAAGRQLTPPERSLDGMEEGALKNSCLAFFAFITDMLSDMYENPTVYGLPLNMLENHLKGRKLNGVKRTQPHQTEKVLSQTHNAVNGYQLLLCMLGRHGELRGNVLTVSADAWREIERRTSTSISPIPLSTRLNALSRLGLERDGDSILSTRYPDMFRGMCALASSSKEMNAFGYFAFQNLEFRNIQSAYKPVYEDYVQPLVMQRRVLADQVDASARKLKMKPACNTFWKVDYKYKGTQVMCLENLRGDLIIRITETYGWDDPSLINRLLAGEDEAFQQHILRHIWGCTGCSTSHLGAFATILGHKRRVCMSGGIGFRWINPCADDMAYIHKCLAFRCRIIDDLKQK